jgi:hypothetical protein
VKKIEAGIARRTELIEAQDECIEAVKKFNSTQSEVALIDSEINKLSVEMMHELVRAKKENYRTMIVIRKGVERLGEKQGFAKVEKEPEVVTSVEVLKKSSYFTADVLLEKILEFYTNRGDEEQIKLLTDFVARLKTSMDPDVSLDVNWTPSVKTYPLSKALKGTKTSEEAIVEGRIQDVFAKAWKGIKKLVDSVISSVQTWSQAISQDRKEIESIIEKI